MGWSRTTTVPECGRSGRKGVGLSARDGVEVCAGVFVDVETEGVVLERVEALESARTSVCRGRGR